MDPAPPTLGVPGGTVTFLLADVENAYCEPKPIQPPTRRSASVGAARSAPCDGGPARPALELRRRPGGGVRAAEGRDRRALHPFGRDPGEIMTSAHLRYDPEDPKALVTEAEAFAEAGLDLGIVYLPPPHSPADLETIADLVAGI